MTTVFYQWHSGMKMGRHMLQSITQPLTNKGGAEIFDSTTNFTCRDTMSRILLVASVNQAEWRNAASVALGHLYQNRDTYSKADTTAIGTLYHYMSILLHVPLHPLCDYVGWLGTEADIADTCEKLCAWIMLLHATTLFHLIRRNKAPA
jgi:hypothetical protein